MYINNENNYISDYPEAIYTQDYIHKNNITVSQNNTNSSQQSIINGLFNKDTIKMLLPLFVKGKKATIESFLPLISSLNSEIGDFLRKIDIKEISNIFAQNKKADKHKIEPTIDLSKYTKL